MVFALKFHLRTHHISSIPFTKLVRTTQKPLFNLQPIRTCSLSPLHVKTKTNSPDSLNALDLEGSSSNSVQQKQSDSKGSFSNPAHGKKSDLEGSNSNGGGSGGDAKDPRKERGDGDGYGFIRREVLRLFLRWAETWLTGPGSENENMMGVGFMAKLAWFCVEAMWLLQQAFKEICGTLLGFVILGVLIVHFVLEELIFILRRRIEERKLKE